MPVRLIESLATTETLADVFSDRSLLQAMLDFEAALAIAEARVGVIPKSAVAAIVSTAKADDFEIVGLVRGTLGNATPGVPLVKAFRERVKRKAPSAADFVHWGATSQDVADTALVLCLKRAQPILAADLARLKKSTEKLAEKYKGTVMLGRTLMQAAPPVTFGLKAAQWLAAISRCARRTESAFGEALTLQFGGATGTLASLGKNGPAVARELAKQLKLALPDAPWHTHRDRLANLVVSLGVLTGELGKMARDISLLMQNEVGEVAEPSAPGRGGSSAMPHKHNPVGCTVTLAAANRVPGGISAFLSAMVQEHERGVGGWQAEWPIVAAVVESTGLAAAAMADVAEGLSVNARRMRENIQATNGVIFAERAMLLLAPKLGRDAATDLVEEASQRATAEGRSFAQILASMPEVAQHFDAGTVHQLEIAEQYLGSAETFRKALVSSARDRKRREK